MAHMMSARAICLLFSPRISIIVLSFVFRVAFVFDLALNNLLFKRCASTEQHNMLSVFGFNFDSDLHCALLTMLLV
jgi:hypothetical protein